MDIHEISELYKKNFHKQYIEKSELLNTVYYDYASINFSEYEFLQILARFFGRIWQITNQRNIYCVHPKEDIAKHVFTQIKSSQAWVYYKPVENNTLGL